MSSWVIFLISPFKNFAWKMNRIFVNEFRLLSIVSLFIELAGNLRSYRWSCNAATANNSRKQLWDVLLLSLMSRQERIIYIEIRRNFNRNTQNMKYILILWSFLTSYENGRSKKYFERFNIDTENVNFNLTSLNSHLVRPFKITTQDSFIIYPLLLMYSITFYLAKQQTESPTPCWCGAVISL